MSYQLDQEVAEAAERAAEEREGRIGWRAFCLLRAGYTAEDAEAIAQRQDGPDKIDVHYAVDVLKRCSALELDGEKLSALARSIVE